MQTTELALLENLFSYHFPKNDQPARYVKLRNEGKHLALSILESCPDSAQRDVAIEKLEECIMWANKSIAVNE